MEMDENATHPGPLLYGRRVRLRAVEPEDAVPMWEMESDSDQWRLNGMMAPLSLFSLRQYANTYEADPYTAGQIRLMAEDHTMIQESGDAEIVGMVDLYDISAANRTAFIGIYVRPCYRKTGYAAEMVSLMERYANDMLNLRTLAVKIASLNEESIRLFSRCGYAECGILRQWIESHSQLMDLHIFQKTLIQS